MKQELRVNPVACSGHGLCAELLPELITLDEWGYPLLAVRRVPASLAKRARRAVTDCPALALLMSDTPDAVSGNTPLRGNAEAAHTRHTGTGPILRA